MLNFLTRNLYGLAIGGSLTVFWLGLRFEGPLEALVLGWSLLVLSTGALLERIAPYDARWRSDHGDRTTDATSALLLVAVVDPLLKAALPILAIALLGSPDSARWPLADWPLAVQIALAVLWIDLAKYVAHRAHHEWPWLWRLHALHHSSERLYWLNNLRFHPLNHALNTALSLLPLLLLGVPQTVLLGAIAFTQPVVLLQHLNVRTRSGWLNGIFSTNELHRWHHSARPSEAHSNYGSALVLWDRLFGTFRPQALHQAPERIGLFGSSRARQPSRASYWSQVLAPFESLVPPCCRPA